MTINHKPSTMLLGGFFIFVVSTVLFVNTSSASQLDEASQAIQRGDYSKAYEIYGLMANDGNAEAQLELASLYYFGAGVPQDHYKAFTWFNLAAKQGLAKAQAQLGHKCGYSGICVLTSGCYG